jgi:hypothetical protein
MSGLPPYDDLPATVQVAFHGRTMLSAKELASVLEMDRETLRKHIRNGDITGRLKGTGRVRRHWVFTIADVAKYFRRPTSVDVGQHEVVKVMERLGRTTVKIGTMNMSFPKHRPRSSKPK